MWLLHVVLLVPTDRQTDRQAGRQAGRQADRQTDRQTDRLTDRQTDSQTDRQTDLESSPAAGSGISLTDGSTVGGGAEHRRVVVLVDNVDREGLIHRPNRTALVPGPNHHGVRRHSGIGVQRDHGHHSTGASVHEEHVGHG